MRHFVDVMRPGQAHGTRKEVQGKAETIIKNWPCAIESTGSGESELAGGVVATATYQVNGYADPLRPIKSRDYLLFNGRKLFVSSVEDVRMDGVEVALTCGEELA